jgi:hypothetical protein
VPPGKYRLRVVLTGYVTEERVIEVVGGEDPTPLEFSLRRLRTGTLEITVADPEGRPVDGLVTNYGTPKRGFRSLMAKKPRPGVYRSEKVEVGTWIVYLSREDLELGMIRVEVEEGETTSAAVTMKPK